MKLRFQFSFFLFLNIVYSSSHLVVPNWVKQLFKNRRRRYTNQLLFIIIFLLRTSLLKALQSKCNTIHPTYILSWHRSSTAGFLFIQADSISTCLGGICLLAVAKLVFIARTLFCCAFNVAYYSISNRREQLK